MLQDLLGALFTMGYEMATWELEMEKEVRYAEWKGEIDKVATTSVEGIINLRGLDILSEITDIFVERSELRGENADKMD